MIRAAAASLLGLAIVAPGCAPYPLRARMSDAEIRAVLDANFSPGMTISGTQAALEALRVPEGRTHLYPATERTPQALLARIFDAGGGWPSGESSTVRWVDVTFVFEPDDHLSRWLLYRDGVRYYGRGPAFGPSRRPMAPVRRFPSPVPPPIDPFEGAS